MYFFFFFPKLRLSGPELDVKVVHTQLLEPVQLERNEQRSKHFTPIICGISKKNTHTYTVNLHSL